MAQIPRVVHIIWLQGKEHLRSTQKRWTLFEGLWKRHMPQWPIRFWDKASIEALLHGFYPELLPKYNRPDAPHAWRADVARYAIVHKFGGMYADSSYEVLQPFDWLLQHPTATFMYLLSDHSATQEMIYSNTNNCWFAATPGHPVMRIIIDEVVAKPHIRPMNALTVYKTTGPIMLWKVMKRLQGRDDIMPVPTQMLDPTLGAISWKACDMWNPEECRRRNPTALAIRWGNTKYASPPGRAAFEIGQFIRRRSGLVMFTMLLVIFGLIATCVVFGTKANAKSRADQEK